MANRPMMTSAKARLAMKKFVTDWGSFGCWCVIDGVTCILLLVRMIKMTVELPITAVREMAQ